MAHDVGLWSRCIPCSRTTRAAGWAGGGRGSLLCFVRTMKKRGDGVGGGGGHYPSKSRQRTGGNRCVCAVAHRGMSSRSCSRQHARVAVRAGGEASSKGITHPWHINPWHIHPWHWPSVCRRARRPMPNTPPHAHSRHYAESFAITLTRDYSPLAHTKTPPFRLLSTSPRALTRLHYFQPGAIAPIRKTKKKTKKNQKNQKNQKNETKVRLHGLLPVPLYKEMDSDHPLLRGSR